MKAQRHFEGAVPIKILEHHGNHAQSMRMLADNGLRPLTYKEALMNAHELIEKLQGRCFYLDGKGIDEDGLYSFNAKGELAKSMGDEPYDKTVYIWSGDKPLILDVLPDDLDYGRFEIIAIYNPEYVVLAMVGTKIDQGAEAPKSTDQNSALAQALRE